MIAREAVIAVTHRCNARCRICDIWSGESKPEVEPSYYFHLPDTLRNINITGGEPLLRDDLPEIVEVMAERCPSVRIVVSTNGLLTGRLEKFLPRLKKAASNIAFRVSLDGLRETHDGVRQIPGAYEKAVRSLDVLRRGKVRDIGVGFTMIRGNENEMIPVFDMALKNGWQFTSTVVHSSPIFFGDHKDIVPDKAKALAAFGELRRRQLKSHVIKDRFRAWFTDGLCDVLEGRPRPIKCRALRDFFYLDPSGNVYPCHMLDENLGGLDRGYENLIETHPKSLDSVDSCLKNCWMTCTVAPIMRESKFKVLHWIMKKGLAGK